MKTLLSLLWWLPVSVFAQEAAPTPTPSTTPDPAETQRQVDVLAGEVEKLKAGQEIFAPVGEGRHGLSPAASKVYGVKQGVSIGGYGEMILKVPSSEDESGLPSGEDATLDFLRAVLYTGYKFTNGLLFNSEIEFEHASTDNNGEVSVEFAYIDWLFRDELNFRAGLLLLPVGLVNELHEPITYLSAQRPITERFLLPSTWREGGIGLFGSLRGLTYRAYGVTGMDAVGGGSAGSGGYEADGLRDGRQNGSQASAESWAFAGRTDWTGTPGLLAGSSLYVGTAGQGNRTPAGTEIDALTTIFDLHVDWRFRGLRTRGLFAWGFVGDAEQINQAKGLTGSDSVGEQLMGGYVEAGYDVLRFVGTSHQLTPFVRWERLDTQFRVPAGFTSNPAHDRTVWTFGLEYRPIVQLTAKLDYELRRNGGASGFDQFNAALGYVF